MKSSSQIVPETALERRIVHDPEWLEGAAWGRPRSGHPEGSVEAHIVEVLANVDRVATDPSDRRRLRLVALLHDTSKLRVDRSLPRRGANHHARLARRQAERFTDDPELLEVIELHDDAYHAWRLGACGGDWPAAEAAAQELIERLGASFAFYLRFYEADNATGDKDQRQIAWFSWQVRKLGWK